MPDLKNDFTYVVAVRRDHLDAHAVETNGSGDFLSLLPSDGLAEVAPAMTAPGLAPFHAWPGA